MFGIERNTRSKEYTWQRDWRVADMANPATPGGGFAFGSATWFTNEPQANLPATAPGGSANPNNPTQAAVDALFPLTACPNPNNLPLPTPPGNVQPQCRQSNNVSNPSGPARFRINRDGTVFSGLRTMATPIAARISSTVRYMARAAAATSTAISRACLYSFVCRTAESKKTSCTSGPRLRSSGSLDSGAAISKSPTACA